MREDAEDDAVTTLTIRKAGHGAGAAAHLAEGALDDVGGAHLDPVSGGDSEKVQQGVAVAFDASDGLWAKSGPALFPVAEGALRFALAARTVHGRGFGHAGAFLAAFLARENLRWKALAGAGDA